MSQQGTTQGGYPRPRRPNPETISYLRSLPLDLQVAREELSQFESSGAAFPQTLAAALAAVDEVRHEVASLAGDEYGSQCLELLAAIVCPYSEYASRWLVYGLTSYHLHLSTHRFGSHVVQTILEFSVYRKNEIDLGEHQDAPTIGAENESPLPSLSDLILGMVDELAPHASQLAVHVCGSHVLRTLLCALGGVVVTSNAPSTDNGMMRRGKAKPKKKKRKAPDAADGQRHNAQRLQMECRREDSRLSLQDESFQIARDQLTEALTGGVSDVASPGELQQLACHASAGPLLITLLRVLTYSELSKSSLTQRQKNDGIDTTQCHLAIVQEGPHFGVTSAAHKLAQRILCWQTRTSGTNVTDGDDASLKKQQSLAVNVLYGISGEPRGSHMVETLLQLSPDETYAELLELGDYTNPSTMQDYVQDDVSNFVVQMLLCTIRSPEQAEPVLKSVEKCISSGYVLNTNNRRRGILWRAVELSVRYRVRQESLLKAIRVGMGLVDSSSQHDSTEKHDDMLTEDMTEKQPKKKKRKKSGALSVLECVPKLLDIRPPESDDGRIGLDPAGTRAIFYLLQFAPRLCNDVLMGIAENVTRDELEWIAKDGLGSRCIFDGITDGPRKQVAFDKARRAILAKLEGRWITLATHRVGHHAVLKLFESLDDMIDKAMLVAELAQNIQRLGGNAMGRRVMDQCSVKQFLEGETAWNEAVRKQRKREQFLKELGSAQVDGKDPLPVKKKRKRKRHKGSHPDDTNAANERPATAVESILHTLTYAKAVP